MNIQRKLTVSVISAFLLVYGVVAFLGIRTIGNEKYQELDKRISYLSSIAADAGAKDIWDFNIDGLKRFISAFSEETAVFGIVYDLASTDTPGARELIGIVDDQPIHTVTTDVAGSMPDEGMFYRVVRDAIEWDGSEIARVHIYYSDRAIQADMNKLDLLFVVMLLTVVLILGVAIYGSLNSIVLKPFLALRQLSAGSEEEIGRLRSKLERQSQIEATDLDGIDRLIRTSNPALGRDDEIGGFAGSLVALMETVKLAISELAVHSNRLAELNEQLEARIQARTQELKTSNDALQASLDSLKEAQAKLVQHEKLASIGQLAAGVAHEINNPIGFVSSNLQTLKEYTAALIDVIDAVDDIVAEPSLEAVRERVAEKKNAVDYAYLVSDLDELFRDCNEGCVRVRDIVQNLKDFSRVDEEHKNSHFNINDAVNSALRLVEHRIKFNCIVRTDLANRGLVDADRGAVNQVLSGLILNAADAIEETGRQGVINVRSYSDGKKVVLEVEDSGVGIPPEVQPRIFDPFFTTKPVGKGTGLGLNIAYDVIVNKHGGEIRCESTYGKGTLIIIELPAYVAKAQTTGGSGGGASHSGGS